MYNVEPIHDCPHLASLVIALASACKTYQWVFPLESSHSFE